MWRAHYSSYANLSIFYTIIILPSAAVVAAKYLKMNNRKKVEEYSVHLMGPVQVSADKNVAKIKSVTVLARDEASAFNSLVESDLFTALEHDQLNSILKFGSVVSGLVFKGKCRDSYNGILYYIVHLKSLY